MGGGGSLASLCLRGPVHVRNGLPLPGRRGLAMHTAVLPLRLFLALWVSVAPLPVFLGLGNAGLCPALARPGALRSLHERPHRRQP